MVFSNAWAQPFCSPTRASILTGLFASRTDVLTPADPLSENHVSVAELLKEEGYSTGVFGKWHMAGVPRGNVAYPGMKPLEAGFDLFKGNLHAALQTFWEYDYHVQDSETAPGEWRTESPPERSLPGIAPTTYAPVVKGADTIEWIAAQEAADPEKPWFAWLAFNPAHATISRTPSQMIVPNRDTLNPAALAEMEACGGEFGSANLGSCTGEQVMRAMTSSMDTVIGKVLEAIDELDPNTYVIFIGDNGTPMYGCDQRCPAERDRCGVPVRCASIVVRTLRQGNSRGRSVRPFPESIERVEIEAVGLPIGNRESRVSIAGVDARELAGTELARLLGAFIRPDLNRENN